MTPSFKLRIVFGLFVLCVFNLCLTKAQMNFFSKIQRNTLRQRTLAIPSTSQNMNLNRQRPLHSSVAASMESINLHSKSPSSSLSSSQSDVYRSLSSPSLNTVKSPAMMKEMTNLHKQAASTLNMNVGNNPFRQKTFLERLRPNPEKVSLVGKYLKNAAIAAAGTGGIITLVNQFSSESVEKDKNNNENIMTANPIESADTIKSTTVSEITNPIGIDK